jgi:hypothetical protein
MERCGDEGRDIARREGGSGVALAFVCGCGADIRGRGVCVWRARIFGSVARFFEAGNTYYTHGDTCSRSNGLAGEKYACGLGHGALPGSPPWRR